MPTNSDSAPATNNKENNMSNNVDAIEIAKFEALAHKWWDRNSEFKPLHDINPLRANYIDQHSPVAGKKLVDIGCGGGILAEAMAQRGATVTAIDMGEAPLSVAAGYLIRHLATGRDMPRAAQNVMDLWRGFIEDQAGGTLEDLQERLADQTEFAKFARKLISDLGYGDQLGDDPDSQDDDQEDQAEDDAEDDQDPDSTGQDDDDQSADADPEQTQEDQQDQAQAQVSSARAGAGS